MLRRLLTISFIFFINLGMVESAVYCLTNWDIPTSNVFDKKDVKSEEENSKKESKEDIDEDDDLLILEHQTHCLFQVSIRNIKTTIQWHYLPKPLIVTLYIQNPPPEFLL